MPPAPFPCLAPDFIRGSVIASGGDTCPKKNLPVKGAPLPGNPDKGGFFFDGHRLPSLFRTGIFVGSSFFFVKISLPEASRRAEGPAQTRHESGRVNLFRPKPVRAGSMR